MKNKNSKLTLPLEDFSGLDIAAVREKIARDFEVKRTEVDEFQVLVAYMSVGNYGCDSSAWLLLRDRNSGALLEVHGSHCSCYGFEGQFKPEPTSLEYLNSDKLHFCCGGYDSHENSNKQAVKDFLKTI